ncbi:AAA family ATPase (plasmid) [Lachnospiraceae bacterium WCA-9-b2]|uniref:AAA family ATPase n=1 Tax=Sporofaciens musculi TaxID=2681861 RepID=A0A7X3MMY5_9FIRM|nr:ATP-binding protein [Sporofaciens musculi]MXP79157.1 AAA family ATPase [Sporofaciens musculi]
MKIQRIALDGFKNLSNVNIAFSKITSLVALNNFGKSNVLSGIDFGINFMKYNEEQRQSLMRSDNAMPINKASLDKDFRYEIEMTTIIRTVKYRIIYGFTFGWLRIKEDEASIKNEYLKVKIDEKGKKYNQLINRQGQEAVYKSSETGRCATHTQIGNMELVVNKLKAFDQLYYIEIIKRLNDLKLYMENNLDPKEFYMPNPIISKGSSEYFIDSRSLPRVIAKLKQINPGKFDLLLDAYKSLFPDIEDVIVKEIQISSEGAIVVPDDVPFIVSDSIYLLFVRDKNLCRLIDFEAMSDGAKRVFMILTKIIMASLEERNISLIAIEEPENSIHPSLFRTYLQIISDLLEDCKVIITSHSPYIISFMDLESIYVGINRDGGMVKFHGFKKNKEKMLEDDADSFDMGMGDYIFSMLTDNESRIEEYLECDAFE